MFAIMLRKIDIFRDEVGGFARDGIDAMTVPDDCQELIQEMRDGANVCESLFMLTTADTNSEVEHDDQQLQHSLDEYREHHVETVNAPWV